VATVRASVSITSRTPWQLHPTCDKLQQNYYNAAHCNTLQHIKVHPTCDPIPYSKQRWTFIKNKLSFCRNSRILVLFPPFSRPDSSAAWSLIKYELHIYIPKRILEDIAVNRLEGTMLPKNKTRAFCRNTTQRIRTTNISARFECQKKLWAWRSKKSLS